MLTTGTTNIPVGDRGSITAVIKYCVAAEGQPEAAADALNLVVVVAVALTFPLQFFAAAETLEHSLGLGMPKQSLCCSTALETKRTLFRCALSAIALALAATIPHLSIVIALLGAVCGGAIELVLPPALVLGSGMCNADLEDSVIGWMPKKSRTALMVLLLALGFGVVISGATTAISALAAVM